MQVTNLHWPQKLTASVAEVVRRQKDIGIDVPGDGEFGKPMAQRVNYGSWWRYSWNRLGGLDPNGPSLYEMEPRRSRPGHVVLTSFGDRRDRTRFAAAYSDPNSGITTGPGRLRRSALRRSIMPATTRSRPTSPISRRRLTPPGSRRAS